MAMRLQTIALTAFMMIMMALQGKAQIRIDLMVGMSTKSTPQTPGTIVNRHLPHEEFVFNMIKVDPGFQAGVRGHVDLSTPFFAEAGITYSRLTSTYHVEYTIIDTEHPVPEHLMKETEHLISVPVNIGVNIGLVDFTSGFRLTKGLGRNSELDNSLSGFDFSGNGLRTGWQASVGVNFYRTRLGMEYQGNFSRIGNGMTVNGQSLELIHVPGQWVFTIRHSF